MEEIKSWPRVLKYAAQDAARSVKRPSRLRGHRRSTTAGEAGDRPASPAKSPSPSPTRPRRARGLNIRFNIGWSRLLPNLDYHHVLMALLALVIIFASLTLGGCTSVTAMVNVYLLELTYQPGACRDDGALVNPLLRSNFTVPAETPFAHIRVAYFGLCLKRTNDTIWQCSNNANGLAHETLQAQDPFNLIQVAATLKDRIVFPWFIIVAIAFLLLAFSLLATFPGWHEETDPRTGSEVDVKPFPSRPVSQLALYATCAATVLLSVSVLWQHVASVATSETINTFTCLSVQRHIGPAAMALGWAAAGVSSVVAIGLIIMILSITALDALTDGDD